MLNCLRATRCDANLSEFRDRRTSMLHVFITYNTCLVSAQEEADLIKIQCFERLTSNRLITSVLTLVV
jgi:hypothetical protein